MQSAWPGSECFAPQAWSLTQAIQVSAGGQARRGKEMLANATGKSVKNNRYRAMKSTSAWPILSTIANHLSSLQVRVQFEHRLL
jgi:hypothetical protein